LFNALYDKLGEDKRAGHAEPPTYEEVRDRAGRGLVRMRLMEDRADAKLEALRQLPL
jgi:hypothetical protein